MVAQLCEYIKKKKKKNYWIASLVAQTVNNLPAMQETQVQSLCQKDPLRRNWQPTPVSCLEKPMDREAYGLPSMGLQRVRHNWTDLACTELYALQGGYYGDELYLHFKRRSEKNSLVEILQNKAHLQSTICKFVKLVWPLRELLSSQI